MKTRIKAARIFLAAALSAALLTGCGNEDTTGKPAYYVPELITPPSSSSSEFSSSAASTVSVTSAASSSSALPISSVTSSVVPGAASSSSALPISSADSFSSGTSSEEEHGNYTVMTVTRTKYAKKAPYPGAERSNVYFGGESVKVVGKTTSGYYKLDNGDYIYADYLSGSDGVRFDMQTVKGKIPSDPPAITDKQIGYDPAAALRYAKERWNKDESLCAEFGSECLTAGGLKYDFASSTALYNSLIASGVGYAVGVDLNEDGTAALPEYVSPGDVIFYYCAAENMMVHTAIYNGSTENGIMKAYAHNPDDNGENEFVYYRKCTDGCGYPLEKIVVFCFYREDDAANSADSAASEDYSAPPDSVP